MKILYVMFAVLFFMGGCSKAPVEGTKAPVVEVKKAPLNEVEEEAKDSKYKPMTNDEIISETHKCESAGLSAQALRVDTYGESTVIIQCKPIQKESK